MLTINNEDVVSCDLLSVEEAKRLPIWILANGTWWWLRSPGGYSHLAACVGILGTVTTSGYVVSDDVGNVRPLLRIANLNFSNLEIGETVKVLGRLAQYVGDNSVLLCEPIGMHRFDGVSNDYETSEVKSSIEQWLKKEIFDAEN